MRRPFVIAAIATAIVLPPIGLHTALAVFLHQRIEAAVTDTGERLALRHDGVSVGLFARSVDIRDPRVIWKARTTPAIQASRLQLRRHSSLLGWLWDGRFDLELRISGLAQDREALKARGATAAQLEAVRRLGLDDGEGNATIRLNYDADASRFTSRFGYTSESGPSASLQAVAANVSGDDIAALGQGRMPTVTSRGTETEYSDDETRRTLTKLAQRAYLSETTLLRLLALPVPYQWAAGQLAGNNLSINRLHVGPMGSTIRVDGLTPASRSERPRWQVERVRLDRLQLATANGGVIVQQLRGRARGLTVPLASMRSELATLLRDAGYAQPRFQLTAMYRHNPTAQALELAELAIISADMGQLTGQLRLQDVNASRLARQPRAALIGASVARVNLTYSDAGAANRLMDALDEQADTNSSGRATLKARLQRLLNARIGPRATTDLMPAIHSFLKEPDRLIFNAAPERPVAIRGLLGLAFAGRYGAITERLQLQSHNGQVPD